MKLNQRIANKAYYLMCKQERTGVCFDIKKAEKLLAYIEPEMLRIEKLVEPTLPSTTPNKGESAAFTPPKKQLNKQGTATVAAENWFDSIVFVVKDMSYYGEKFYTDELNFRVKLRNYTKEETVTPLVTKIPMLLKHQEGLKNYLMDKNWKPTFWNIKKERNKQGKLVPVRVNGKTVKTSPKFQHLGKMCPNLAILDFDRVIYIVKWLSLRNRKGVIEGWLSNPRLEIDSRLPTRSSGLTNTKRQKHSVVCNVPKNDPKVTLGKEMRELFIPPKGMVMVGWDASGLEARVKGHFTSKYDNGAYAKKILSESYDEHEENAGLWNCERREAKTPGYALQYFCKLPTFCESLGLSLKEGKSKYEAYWEKNWALRLFDEDMEKQWIDNNKKFVYTIDGGKILTRARHSITNAVFQSTGAKIMDVAGLFLDDMAKHLNDERNIYYHDEYLCSCNPEDAEELGKLGVESIIKAGQFFKLHVPLDAEYKIGKSWADCH